METNAGNIRGALKLFPGNTAIGANVLHFRALAELPDVALEQLGLLFKAAVANLSLPVQASVNLLCPLGKKTGGSRAIAIMCAFHRAHMKANGSAIREWDLEHGHMYDSALACRLSLRAAALRALKIEDANAMSLYVGHMCWDMEEFYESIDLYLSR